MAEEARLESVCTPKGYREFESRSLRKKAGAFASAFCVEYLIRGRFAACSFLLFRTFALNSAQKTEK